MDMVTNPAASETPQDAREVERREVPTRHHVVAGSVVGVWADAQAERERAHAKHGEKSMESAPWTSERRLRILLEEVGEVAREFNEADIHDREPDRGALYAELIQVVAMAGAWAEATAVWRYDSVFTPALTTPFTDREQAPLAAERDALKRDLAQAVSERDEARRWHSITDKERLNAESERDRLRAGIERLAAYGLSGFDMTPTTTAQVSQQWLYQYLAEVDAAWRQRLDALATPDADAQDEGAQR